jgi:hypothetical protein
MVADRAARAPAAGPDGHPSATTRHDSPRAVDEVAAGDAECRQPLWGSSRQKIVVALASKVADEPPCRLDADGWGGCYTRTIRRQVCLSGKYLP